MPTVYEWNSTLKTAIPAESEPGIFERSVQRKFTISKGTKISHARGVRLALTKTRRRIRVKKSDRGKML
jgi:hypothetical protein